MMQPSQPQEWYWKGNLFTRPSTFPGMVGREREKKLITDFLASDKAALHIVGIGGIGKSYLSGWLAREGRGDHTIAWVDCRQQSVTVEGLVASIGAVTHNQFINDQLKGDLEPPSLGKTAPLSDAIDHCIDALDQARCLLVLQNFNDLDESTAARIEFRLLHTFLQSLESGKIVLVSRRTPALWDESDLRSRQAQIQLSGLSKDETRHLLTTKSIDLPTPLLDAFWQKTGRGVPQAIELLAARLQANPDSSDLQSVLDGSPIYSLSNGREWLGAQIQDLSTHTKNFLQTMSMLRRPELLAFCKGLWRPSEDFERRLNDLRARCLLDPTERPEVLLVTNLFRDYLVEAETSDQRRFELHDRIAREYQSVAMQTGPDRNALLTEAIWHAAKARNPERVLAAASGLRLAPELKDNLELLGQCDQAIVEAARQMNNTSVLLQWLPLRGNRLSVGENLPQAIETLSEAAQLAMSRGTSRQQYEVLKSLAAAYNAQGRYVQALSVFAQCLELAKASGDAALELDILPEIGNAQLRNAQHIKDDRDQRHSQLSQAEDTLDRCIQLARQQNNRLTEAKAVAKKARLYLKHKQAAGDRKTAFALLQTAQRMLEELGDQHYLAEVLGLLGDYYRYEKNLKSAYQHYTESSRLEQQLGLRAQQAISLGQLAFLARDMADYDMALKHCLAAEQISDRLGNVMGKQIDLVLRAEILIAMNCPQEALPIIQEARRLSLDSAHPQPIGLASANRALAKYYRAIGDLQHAKEDIETALRGYIETQTYQYARETWEVAAEIYQEWVTHVDLDTLRAEFNHVALDETRPYHLERTTLLANLYLAKLKASPSPSEYFDELCESMSLLDLPRDQWGNAAAQFCLDYWPALKPDVFPKVLPWTTVEAQRSLYSYWIEAALRAHRPEFYRTIIDQVTTEAGWSFEDRYNLLEPLEFEAASQPELCQTLANCYINLLAKEIDRCIRLGQPLPLYAYDIRSALYFLERKQYYFIKDYITDGETRARQERVVAQDFVLAPELPRLDLGDKRVVLIGGYAKIRRQAAEETQKQFGLRQIVEIAPSWEEKVNEKKVREAVQAADLIVVVYRQMKHDSSEALAAALGDDNELTGHIRYAAGHGKSSIVRTIREYFTSVA